MMMHPILYHSLFISYSSKDETLARRLHNDLQDHGVRCWFAPEDLKIGNKIRDHIDQAIQIHDRSLLLLSEHSIASAWVEHEVEAALEKEDRQKREILFPVRLDEAIMHTSKAWAATLRRTRHISDFTNWIDPQVYQIAFDRLLRDLKKVDEPQKQETKQ
jgi:TIR domain